MLSISNIGNKQASSYYEKDNYYCRRDDMDNAWQGKLVELAELPPQVVREDFNAFIKGRDERAGFDLCFSAPKSVSVAMVTDDQTRRDMVAAHDAAVASVLAKIESREIGTRVTKNNVTEHVKTGNMLCAKFRHYVSRTSDPQLHTHAVILNQTAYDGKLYAVDNPDLYKNKILYGQMYRSELAAELLKKGYDIHVSDAEKGFFELKGIPEAALDHFSQRRKEILEKLKSWDTYGAVAAEKAVLLTRHAKEQKDLGLLTESWRATLNEMGGVQIEKAEGPVLRTAEEKQQAFEKAMERLSRKEFAFTEKDLKRATLAAGIGSGLSEEEYLKLLQQHSGKGKDLISIGPRLDQPDGPNYYTTRRNMETEKEIFQTVAAGKNSLSGLSRLEAERYLKGFVYEKGELNEQQHAAAVKIATTGDKYVAVQGLAGTGKTYMLNFVRQIYEKEGYTVTGAAFAGKAADGLEADSGIKSGTIHRFLNRLEREAGNMKPEENFEDKTKWNLEGLQKAPGKEVWVIDEAGMVDNSLMKNVMEAAKIRDAKVILMGDDKQLPPIGVGNAFGTMIQTGKIDAMVIDHIMRQKDTPDLLASVKEAVLGDTGKSLDLLGENVIEIKKPKARFEAIVKEYTGLSPEEQKNTVILTAANKDRIKLNQDIRAELKRQGVLPEGKEFKVENGKGRSQIREFSQGDKVIFLQNDNRLDVKNGKTGIIQEIRDKTLIVKTGDKTIEVDLSKYKKIDHGYAMTTHKSQSITVGRVLIYLDSKLAHMNNRNSYYVDISRAKYEVKVFTDNIKEIRNQVRDFARKLTSEDFAKVEKTPKKTLSQHVEEAVKKMAQSIRFIKAPEIKAPVPTMKGPSGPSM
jgi:conjugative relaxase-like TrwC/TraI family protein